MGRRGFDLRGCALDQWLDFCTPLSGSDPKIALRLQAKPEFGVGVEGLRDAEGHVCRDSGLSVQYAGERWPGDSQVPRNFRDRSAIEIAGEDFSGMRGIVHGH